MTDAERLRRLLAAYERYVDGQTSIVDRLAGTNAGADTAVVLRAHLDQLDAAVREAHLVLAAQQDGAGADRG